MTQHDDRDLVVAEALARLDVPEHRPDFFPGLRERLDDAAAPRARRFRLGSRLPYAAAAAAVAVAAVVAVAVVQLSAGTDTASAADVRSAVTRALGSIRALGGVVVVNEAGPGETRWSFLLDADGNVRVQLLGGPVVIAYDARENVERISDLPSLTLRDGVAPGPPDSQSSAWMVQRGLGSVVRALDAAGGDEVQEIRYRGRGAWLLRTHTQNAGEQREITVDRETGVPVRDVVRRGGRIANEWRIDDLRVDPPVPAGAFRLRRASGQQLIRWDHGFRRAPLEEASETVGYQPLVPGWLPDGFERAETALARSSRPTGNEQRQNPESRDVVSTVYRRGIDGVVVTTRRVGSSPAAWADPVAMGDLSRTPSVVTPTSGALAGSRVEVVVDPNATPHTWGIADGLVVTVSGALTRDELVRVTESLRPLR
jgi:hypothetical protein